MTHTRTHNGCVPVATGVGTSDIYKPYVGRDGARWMDDRVQVSAHAHTDLLSMCVHALACIYDGMRWGIQRRHEVDRYSEVG